MESKSKTIASTRSGPGPGYNRAPVLNGAGEMLDSNVACCVETLCNKGCKAVRDDIAALESGQGLPETRELRAEEVRAVLAELKSIMAVYGDVCRSPS